jgi:hypothetical protein
MPEKIAAASFHPRVRNRSARPEIQRLDVHYLMTLRQFNDEARPAAGDPPFIHCRDVTPSSD